MQSKIKKQKLVLTSILLMAAFTYPVISIANKQQFIGGIPVLFLYVLLTWIIAIIIYYSITNTRKRKTDE